jgi:hypothetical protein
MRHLPILLLPLLVALVPLVRAADPDPRGVEFFEKKIRPVLVEHCYACHSEEAAKNKKLRGGLYLDSREGVLKGGDSGVLVLTDKPADSLLVKALRHAGDVKMPPKAKLPDAVIADFEAWAKMGAPDPRTGTSVAKKVIDIEAAKQYWAFRPLAPVAPPTITSDRVRTPIDRFILAKLGEAKLTLNPATAPAKLLRRLTYDLTGLPPTPEEIAEFEQAAIRNPQSAIEQATDRLLASPAYGERWGRHWLDVVRFAESGGYEFDGDRPGAYHFRDFVIRALNADMPYDEFVRLQLAGDRIKPGDLSATAATGFLVSAPYPGQTTAKTREIIRYDHLDDMLSVASQSLFGLTMGCARCHDHKFDPLPQADYYHLLACLARTDSNDAKIDPNPEATRKLKAEFDAAHAPFVAAVERFEKESLSGKIKKWYGENQNVAIPVWYALDPITAMSKTPLKKLDDNSGAVLATGKAEPTETYTLTYHTETPGIKAIRVEALANQTLPKTGPGRGPNGEFTLSEIAVTATAKGGQPTPLKIKNAKTPWTPNGSGARQAIVYEVEGNVGTEGGTALTVVLKFDKGYAAGVVRVSLATKVADINELAAVQHAPELAALLRASNGEITPANRDGVIRRFRALDAEAGKIYQARDDHAAKEPKPALVSVFSATSGRGGDVHHLIRGEVEKKNGVAKPGFVQVLEGVSADGGKRWLPAADTDPRIALGNWATDPEQGGGRLLARVIVNRLWQHHMGRGLVRTPNDFGVQGEPPTHPELLDWLASELIRGGWKLKPIHKLIVTSAVYAQSGEVNDAALKADPTNKLWWRVPPRRLEAEAVRDAVLAVSGTLDATLYGPGTLDENSARRSVYLTVKRSRLTPFLQTFDAPEPVQSVGERVTTTVPPQALAMMNSPLVRQRAEKLAARVQPKSESDLPAAIERAYLLTVARKPTTTERDRMVAFVKSRPTGLADACHVLLCLNEFIYVD